MDDMIAQLLLPDGPARLSANGGTYDINSEIMAVDGPVQLTAADGYRMTANGVSVDLERREMSGDKGVAGEIAAGTFSANTLRADLSARTLTLAGDARMPMTPGKVRLPE